MKILAHRGFWIEPHERNTLNAFKRAFDNGFGVETDLRDSNGEIVIAHDIPSHDCLLFEDFLSFYNNYGSDNWLALNIKADGLAGKIAECLDFSPIKNYFLFDMSTPDMRSYISKSYNIYTRLSDFEKEAVFESFCKGIWLDAFESDWFDSRVINKILDKGKSVAIVSPELHQREYMHTWTTLKNAGIALEENISLCTDYPLKAREFFNAKN